MLTINLREKYDPIPKQVDAHQKGEQYVLYGGAVRSGKTVWLVMEGMQLCLDYPGNVGYLARRELRSFRRTTQVTWDKFVPSELIEQHHQTENFYKFKNGSIVYYGGLGDDKVGLDRLKSMELGWFGIDQAEETSESHFLLLMSRLSLKLSGVRYKGLLTANPAPGWLRDRFIDQSLANHAYVFASPKDNVANLPPNYYDELRKDYPEAMAKALIDGDWDIEGGANYLFPYSVIREATLRLLPRKGFKYLGVDIARYGDDESVAIVRHGNTVSDVYNWMGTDTMESALRVFDIIREHNPAVVNIDVIGPGSGVVDKLRELGVKCNGVNASGKARNPDYHNARAEMFWRLRDLFEQGFISIPDHSKLTSQLAGIKYTFAANGTKAIVSKEEMRKSGSKSPDYADALALAFYSTTPAFNRIVSKSFTRYR